MEEMPLSASQISRSECWCSRVETKPTPNTEVPNNLPDLHSSDITFTQVLIVFLELELNQKFCKKQDLPD